MKSIHPLLLAALPICLAACGGGGSDLGDRLDVADPVVRFVHASPLAPHVTLYRGSAAVADAADAAYTYASNYFDIGTSTSRWTLRSTDGSITFGGLTIDPRRGDRYTIVALPSSDGGNGLYLITDPYNKPLSSTSTHLRVMNASFNAANIDVYVNPVGSDISPAGALPFIPNTGYKTSGPASGNDSMDLPGGAWQIAITPAGSKTILYKGLLNIGNNQDVLIVTVPTSLLPGAIQPMVKIEGTPGLVPLPAL